jgi:23S rRNA (cytidine2498-2'-O)-methyltransferase
MHFRMTAETFLNTHQESKYDLIVNDMKMSPEESSYLMVQMAQLLLKNGQGIMTLKLPKIRPQILIEIVDEAKRVLSQVYRVMGVRQLFHNRSEVTMYLRR